MGLNAMTSLELIIVIFVASLIPTIAIFIATILVFKIRGDVRDTNLEIKAGIQQMLAISRLFAYKRGTESTQEERNRVIDQLEKQKKGELP